MWPTHVVINLLGGAFVGMEHFWPIGISFVAQP